MSGGQHEKWILDSRASDVGKFIWVLGVGVGVMTKKGKWGQAVLSSKEDDSKREKERERDARRCAWPPGGRGFGVPGQCSGTVWGACLNVDFWLNGTGVRFWHFKQAPGVSMLLLLTPTKR